MSDRALRRWGTVSYHTMSLPLDDRRRACGLVPTDRSHASKMYARRLVTHLGDMTSPEALGSTAPPHSGIAHEEGLAYEIDFAAAIHADCFIDQRANRRRVRTSCSGTLLNLFAIRVRFPWRQPARSANRQRRSGKIRPRPRPPQFRS